MFLASVMPWLWPGLRDEVIAAWRYLWARRLLQVERERSIIEAGPIGKNELRQRPEALTNPVKLGLGIGKPDPEPLVNILIEALEEFTPRVVHARADARVHLLLELLEGGLDFG